MVVLDRAGGAMQRASLANQARVHGGYHYPRSPVTARSSAAGYEAFRRIYAGAAADGFAQVYAIAAQGSLVSARQFAAVMRAVGAPLEGAGGRESALFAPSSVEALFRVRECAFDARALRRIVLERSAAAGVSLLFGEDVEALEEEASGGSVVARMVGGARMSARLAFNCTYGRIHALHPRPLARTVKYEVCDVALVSPPPAMAGVGITVMDGPFWSCMPYPAGGKGVFSLTHVRHTPGVSWLASEYPDRDPYAFAAALPDRSETAFEAMRHDAARFVPCMADARRIGGFREVKAVLSANESDDGRPILLDGRIVSGVTTVMGGKLDNVFDALAEIDEAWGRLA